VYGTKYYSCDQINKTQISGACIRNAGKIHNGFCWGELRERGHLEDLGLDDRITLKLIFKAWDRESSTALIWFRIGIVAGGLF
jgi:hypothetical protein